jgi:hypothetical protein
MFANLLVLLAVVVSVILLLVVVESGDNADWCTREFTK